MRLQGLRIHVRDEIFCASFGIFGARSKLGIQRRSCLSHVQNSEAPGVAKFPADRILGDGRRRIFDCRRSYSGDRPSPTTYEDPSRQRARIMTKSWRATKQSAYLPRKLEHCTLEVRVKV